MRTPPRRRSTRNSSRNNVESTSRKQETQETTSRSRQTPDRLVKMRPPAEEFMQGLVSPPISASRFPRTPVIPESPFSGFASNLPNLDPADRVSCNDCTSVRASPFTAFSSSLPNLGNSPSVSSPAGVPWSISALSRSSARQASITTSPAWQHPSRAVRRSLLAEDLDQAGENSANSGAGQASEIGPNATAASAGPPSACKTPQTPMRIQQLYSFGDGPILSEVLLDPSSPVALIGSFAQFAHRSGESCGDGLTPLLGSSRSSRRQSEQRFAQPSSSRNSRRRLETTKDDFDEEDAPSSRRIDMDVAEDGVSVGLGTPMGSVPGSSQSIRRRRAHDVEVNVWEDDQSGVDFAVRLALASHMFDEHEEEEVEDRRLSMSSVLSEKRTPSQAERKEAKASVAPFRPGGPPPPAAREIRDASRQCKCKKSKCIRQYCVCFRAAELCKGCECVDCLNDGHHEMERKAAVEHIKTSDPLAFHEKVRSTGSSEEIGQAEDVLAHRPTEAVAPAPAAGAGPQQQHIRGCKCKNSRCQKKYCECFEFGVTCSSRCTCRQCHNGKDSQSGEAEEHLIQTKKLKRGTPAIENSSINLKNQHLPARYQLQAGKVLTGAVLVSTSRRTIPIPSASPQTSESPRASEDIQRSMNRTPPQTPLNTSSREFLLAPYTPVEQSQKQASANLSFSSVWSIAALSPAPGLPIQISSCISVTTESPAHAETVAAAEETGALEAPNAIETDVEKPGAVSGELGSIVCIIADEGIPA